MQEVLAVLGPRPVRVLGDVQQRGLGGGHHASSPRVPYSAQPLVVVRLQLRQVRAGEERQPQPGRAAGRGLGAAADQQQRVRLGVRARGDPYRAAPVRERLAGPGLQQRLQQLVLERAAPLPLHAERRVLLGPVADARDRDQPPAAQQVEHGDVLGQPQRVVQRADDRRDGDRDPPGGAEDRAREGEAARAASCWRRRGAPRSGRWSMPALVGVRGHLEGGPVAGADRDAGVASGSTRLKRTT